MINGGARILTKGLKYKELTHEEVKENLTCTTTYT